MLNVEMLSTGDEVLHGQIVDTNAAWLADFFFNQGLPLTRRNTVGDNLNDYRWSWRIARRAAVNDARAKTVVGHSRHLLAGADR